MMCTVRTTTNQVHWNPSAIDLRVDVITIDEVAVLGTPLSKADAATTRS
jgi:hypothetical protein